MKDRDNGEGIPCLDSVRFEFTGIASKRQKVEGRRQEVEGKGRRERQKAEGRRERAVARLLQPIDPSSLTGLQLYLALFESIPYLILHPLAFILFPLRSY
jgi:hypothetical protein